MGSSWLGIVTAGHCSPTRASPGRNGGRGSLLGAAEIFHNLAYPLKDIGS
ncbi:MAG TPA: hypothetical protein VN872_13100 [Candidatus Acidoferrum sp.]|nr:hypothetical protein [Candidatus Acidoferrum sp.]